MINYNTLFFKTGNPITNNYDFYKRFGRSYDLFYDLISETISIQKAVKEQNEMITKIDDLRDFILSKKKVLMNKKVKVL